jgi:hypothetical protein
MWHEPVVEAERITGDVVRQILRNEVGVVVVHDALPRDACAKAASTTLSGEAGELGRYEGPGFDGGTKRVMKLGVSQWEGEGVVGKPEYLDAASEHNRMRESLFPSGQDRVTLSVDRLRETWTAGTVEIAMEDGRQCCCGLCRVSQGSYLHFDNASVDAPIERWPTLGRITRQVGLNFILATPPREAN